MWQYQESNQTNKTQRQTHKDNTFGWWFLFLFRSFNRSHLFFNRLLGFSYLNIWYCKFFSDFHIHTDIKQGTAQNCFTESRYTSKQTANSNKRRYDKHTFMSRDKKDKNSTYVQNRHCWIPLAGFAGSCDTAVTVFSSGFFTAGT